MPRPQVVVNDEHVTRVTVTPSGDDGEEEDISEASKISFEDDELPIKYCRDRKVSLMPALTEEDMMSSLGQKDPLLVSQIISGRQAAVEEEFPTMCRIAIGQSGTRVIQGVLANEACIRPEMAPELMTKSAEPPVTDNGFENNVQLPSGTTLKFRSNHHPPQRSQSDNVHLRRARPQPQSSVDSQTYHLKQFTAEIAAENPDMIHFQQVLNEWIMAQTGAKAAAFLLISSECNSCFCQVCGSELMDEPINCGDASVLTSLFGDSSVSSVTTPTTGGRSTDEIEQRAIDFNDVDAELRARILEITADGVPKSVPVAGTVIPVKARCGFVTGLIMIHQSAATKNGELAAVLPHVNMIGTLMSIVANVEEQKRLARQSQVFLSMAHNVFSSLRLSELAVP
ncbi:hypothetical protein QR680_014111 [Steinernema hermaphroditum]|uniref:Uncharacterized protein n=1 Tax=Steinernema hermaphroditum TaxID=289476 RepID=A0AA39I7R1_9BILA|nr:hypothetical protein QR680_014111 [Steinernema hermaphroditum]